jgi:hypothetical protein
LFVVNLEGVVSSDPLGDFGDSKFHQNLKVGPLLSNQVAPELSGACIYTLANNHFMDFGIDAAKKTIQFIAARGSKFVGFGDSLDSARVPLRINYEGKVIALFSVSETQYGEAEANLPGISFIGPWIFDAISKEKKESDFVIVLFHGGLEDATWSAPWTQELLRSYVDAGANLVVAHHPHKPQSPERYRDGLIYYSLGNFCVDPHTWRDYPLALYSLGVNLEVVDNAFQISTRYFMVRSLSVPYDIGVEEIFPGQDHELITSLNLSKKILESYTLTNDVWNETCKFHWDLYLKSLIGLENRSFSFSESLKNLILFMFNRKRYRARRERISRTQIAHLYHAFSNENHRALLLHYLRNDQLVSNNAEAREIVKTGLGHLLK